MRVPTRAGSTAGTATPIHRPPALDYEYYFVPLAANDSAPPVGDDDGVAAEELARDAAEIASVEAHEAEQPDRREALR